MLRDELQFIVGSYLRSPMGPQGSLYDISDDMFIDNILKSEGLSGTVDRARELVAGADDLGEARKRLQIFLNGVTAYDFMGYTWSRHAMKAFFALNQALELIRATEATDTENDYLWEALSFFSAHDADFQPRAILHLNGHSGQPEVLVDGHGTRPTITSNVSEDDSTPYHRPYPKSPCDQLQLWSHSSYHVALQCT